MKRIKRSKTDTAATLYPEWTAFHEKLSKIIERWLGNECEEGVEEEKLVKMHTNDRGADLRECDHHHKNWLIENNTNDDVILRIASNRRIKLPTGSAMLWSDISLWGDLECFTYKHIVIDPPWPSHSVRRSNSYSTLQLSSIKDIKIKEMTSDGAVIAVWVTNNLSVIQCALDCFTLWGVGVSSVLVWLKYSDPTKTELVCPLNSTHRKPYEICIVGKKGSSAGCSLSYLLRMPLRIIKTQRDAHSRKPFVGTYLESICRCADPKARSLELFARTVYPYWVCAGNEAPAFNEILPPVEKTKSVL